MVYSTYYIQPSRYLKIGTITALNNLSIWNIRIAIPMNCDSFFYYYSDVFQYLYTKIITMTIYHSKIDHWIWVFSTTIILSCIFVPIIIESSTNWIFIVSLIASALIPILIIINIYTNTYYSINERSLILRVKSGIFLDSKYDINKITRITNTRSILSAPALSLDRIEVTIGQYNNVVISPENKEKFI